MTYKEFALKEAMRIVQESALYAPETVGAALKILADYDVEIVKDEVPV